MIQNMPNQQMLGGFSTGGGFICCLHTLNMLISTNHYKAEFYSFWSVNWCNFFLTLGYNDYFSGMRCIWPKMQALENGAFEMRNNKRKHPKYTVLRKLQKRFENLGKDTGKCDFAMWDVFLHQRCWLYNKITIKQCSCSLNSKALP